VSAAVLAASGAFAGDQPAAGDKAAGCCAAHASGVANNEKPMCANLAILNLNADQKAQIKAVLSGEKDILMPLLGQLHDARKDLRAAIHAGDANETNVRAAAAKVAAVEGDLAVERMKIYGKIAPILTDEQRRQIADFEQRADNFVDSAIGRIGERLGN